jgi:hypothetical protein
MTMASAGSSGDFQRHLSRRIGRYGSSAALSLADRGHSDPDAPLLYGYTRPDVIDQLPLLRSPHPDAGQRQHTLAPKHPPCSKAKMWLLTPGF